MHRLFGAAAAAEVLLIVAGAVIAIVGARYGLVHDNGAIGPGVMPLVAGSILVLGALQGLLQRDRTDDDERAQPSSDPGQGEDDADTKAEGAVSSTGAVPVIGLITIMGLGTVAMPYAGFVLSSGCMIIAILSVIERVPIWRSAMVAVVAATILWLLVDTLRIPVPPGSLFLIVPCAINRQVRRSLFDLD